MGDISFTVEFFSLNIMHFMSYVCKRFLVGFSFLLNLKAVSHLLNQFCHPEYISTNSLVEFHRNYLFEHN